jgi:hypothetical protein
VIADDFWPMLQKEIRDHETAPPSPHRERHDAAERAGQRPKCTDTRAVSGDEL